MTKKYCIIGAGFCGLGVAKALRDHGIDYDCFEKNDEIGGNWLNGVYDSTHIISSRKSTQFTEFPMPADYPDFPSRQQILDYLKAYADHFKLREKIIFKSEVLEARPLSEDGMKGWRVRLSNGQVREYAGVIVANGHHWDKREPKYPGHFAGKTIHTKDYKRPGDFEGSRVLVVGAGNSGCDLAVEAALSGHESYISMRRGYYFLPKTLFGVPTAEFDRPWMPLFAQKAFVKTALKLVNGPNSRYGLQEPDHELFDHHPIVNSQLMYFLRHGRVKAKPDIARFDGKTVHFVDGSSLEIDTVIWATGYNVSFPFLDRKLFEWENGIPKRVASTMPRKMAGLYIFGLSQPRGGGGPLISAGAQFMAELLRTQEVLDHPISIDFEKVKAPSAKMLVGVSQSMREIKIGRMYLRWLGRGKVKRLDPPRSSGALPKPRNPKFPFTNDIPRHWFWNRPIPTHYANSLNLLFPYGERYFIRSVKPFLSQVRDPRLAEALQGFMAQEIQHGREHERFFDVLRAQGFNLDTFLKYYNLIAYGFLEKVFPAKLNLAVTAAVEHYTATFARIGFEFDYLEKHAHPVMADLFYWHCAEELEHKSVAYDLLNHVAPSYALRVAGMAIATATMGGFWTWAALDLIRQDPEITWKSLIADLKLSSKQGFLGRGEMGRALLEYLKPGFHPDHYNDLPYIERVTKKMQARAAELSAATAV